MGFGRIFASYWKLRICTRGGDDGAGDGGDGRSRAEKLPGRQALTWKHTTRTQTHTHTHTQRHDSREANGTTPTHTQTNTPKHTPSGKPVGFPFLGANRAVAHPNRQKGCSCEPGSA